MNGLHDMGGQQGYGPVQIEANEPLFHGEWERRALGVTVAMGASGLWNIDLARSARESLPPLDYVQGPYYAIWTKALQNMLIERGLITAEELAQGQAITPPVAGVRLHPRRPRSPRLSISPRRATRPSARPRPPCRPRRRPRSRSPSPRQRRRCAPSRAPT